MKQLPSSFDIMANNHSRAWNNYQYYIRQDNKKYLQRLEYTFNKRLLNIKKCQYRIFYLNDDKFKIVKDKIYRREKGFEKELLYSDSIIQKKLKFDKTMVSEMTKDNLRQSLSRTKRIIREYGYCNDWDYFVTLTFDRTKNDSSDYKKLSKSVRIWLANYKARKNIDLKYILIPELHKDKKHYHFHGLIKNINNVVKFRNDKKGHMRYNWKDWDLKFGYTSLGSIRHKDKTVSYILKYITKDMIQYFNSQRYYVSKGLQKSILIQESENELKLGTLKLFENEYCTSGYIDLKQMEYIRELNKLMEV